MSRRFIETEKFPVDEVNEASAKEKMGGGRPEFWEMVFWWTRKPLIGARAVIAASLLPAEVDISEFKRITRLAGSKEQHVPHRQNPSIPERFKNIFVKARLLDPFAGFGSIPLEAMRLGVGEVVAVELLPVAYVFLKAVLEYPRKYGSMIVKDVEKWGKWIVENLRNDPDIKELYDEDIAVYIGTWEVKCPHCGNYTPIIGNWWLARVAGGESEEGEEEEEGVKSGVFKRIAWMRPKIAGNTVYVEVMDLNMELKAKNIRAKVNTRQGIVEASNMKYDVPKPNIESRKETATCLICNNIIKTVKGQEWHVRRALKSWNTNLEHYLEGKIDLKTLLDSDARPRLLVKVKVKKGDLEFEPTTPEDDEKLWKALEKLRQMWGDPDIPREVLPFHELRSVWVLVYGFNEFYKLFNPRQLLTLMKLTKLIREAGKKIEEEKLKEGWNKEEAFKYAEAVITYLAIMLCKHADYNSMMTCWHSSFLIAAHTLSMRGIAMMWNWSEYNPFSNYQGTLKATLDRNVSGLSYIVSSFRNTHPNLFSERQDKVNINVLLDDATILGKVSPHEKFDLIVTDPPYRDDVPYTELSDFYYVWLKRALSEVDESLGYRRLAPRFLREAFFDEFGSEIEVQWKVFAPREVSEDEGRAAYFGKPVGSFEYFKELLSKSFVSMAERLADDGLLVTFYAHTSPEAWEALLEAGWQGAKLRVTAAHAMLTESGERVVARGKASLDMSIVVVWRKGVSGVGHVDRVYVDAVEACSSMVASKYLHLGGVNLFVATLGCVLSQFTKYERLVGVRDVKSLVEGYIYPAAAEAIAMSLGAAAGARLSPESIFYILAKVLIYRRPRQVMRVLDRSTTIILSIGTRSDLKKLEGNIIEREGGKFTLLEPVWGVRELRSAVGGLLSKKGLDPGRAEPKNAVDVLHLLEYYALTLPRDALARRLQELRDSHPQFFEEAVAIARVLAEALHQEDPEKKLAGGALEALGRAPRGGLDKYF